MLNIPMFTRLFATILISLGVYLAAENTLISAAVLADESGASAVAATAISVAATGLELIFASWIRSSNSVDTAKKAVRRINLASFLRMFIAGCGLALVYHFDILTTAKHANFDSASPYFFFVVVAAFVFGPEICIVLSAWLMEQARDTETRQMADGNARDAENAFRKAERLQLVDLAREAGKDKATKKAVERWG